MESQPFSLHADDSAMTDAEKRKVAEVQRSPVLCAAHQLSRQLAHVASAQRSARDRLGLVPAGVSLDREGMQPRRQRPRR